MRSVFITGCVLLAAVASGSAQAQTSTAFRGVYVEGQAGGSRFQSQGVHNDKFGFGVAGGFDGTIGDKWVIGPQFGYWRSRPENQTQALGGLVNHKSFNEVSAGVRGGYLFTPQLLGYVGGGYSTAEQRRAFTGINGTTTGQFYDRFNTDGYYLTAGAEYSLTPMFYVGAGYRYANYADHTATQRLFGSVGVRFK